MSCAHWTRFRKLFEWYSCNCIPKVSHILHVYHHLATWSCIVSLQALKSGVAKNISIVEEIEEFLDQGTGKRFKVSWRKKRKPWTPWSTGSRQWSTQRYWGSLYNFIKFQWAHIWHTHTTLCVSFKSTCMNTSSYEQTSIHTHICAWVMCLKSESYKPNRRT